MAGDTLEHEKEVNKDKLEYVQAVADRHYATDNAQALWDNKVEREQALSEERNAGNKKDKLQARRKIRDTRKRDVEVIKRDWMENQPEKYAFHLIKEILFLCFYAALSCFEFEHIKYTYKYFAFRVNLMK